MVPKNMRWAQARKRKHSGRKANDVPQPSPTTTPSVTPASSVIMDAGPKETKQVSLLIGYVSITNVINRRYQTRSMPSISVSCILLKASKRRRVIGFTNPTMVVLWTKSTPSRNPVQTPTSPTRTAPKPSYSQVAIRHPPEPATKPGQQPATKENLRPCDPGKFPPHDLTRDSSRDLQALEQARDLTAHDHGNLTHDLPRNWSSTWSPDHTCFLRTSRPLTHTWKTMGTINGWSRINKVTRLTAELWHSPQSIYY